MCVHDVSCGHTSGSQRTICGVGSSLPSKPGSRDWTQVAQHPGCPACMVNTPSLIPPQGHLAGPGNLPPTQQFLLFYLFRPSLHTVGSACSSQTIVYSKNHCLTCNWRKWIACRTGQKPKNQGTHLRTEGSSCYVGWGDGVCVHTHLGKCVCESHPKESDTSENC